MTKKYKKSQIVINLLLALDFIFLLFNIFVFKQTSYLFCIISILVPFIIIVAMYGYERKKRRYMYELIFYIFAYSILILLLTYIIGIFVGYTKNIYKLDLTNLIHNIIPYLVLIITSELFRYEIVRKGSGSPTSYALITIILIFIDVTMFLTTYNLNLGDEQIKFICSIVLPSIFKNIILLYFAKISGPIPNMIYRIMFDLKLVVLPIFPNFGLYLDSIINCILPVLMYGIVELNIRKDERKNEKHVDVRKKFIYKYLFIFVLVLITLSFNLLISGKFKYSMVSIGSGSMSPKIEKGDVVVYEKIDKKHMPKIGEILVFKKDHKVVVHRIIEIVDMGNNEYVYYTKGDANDSPDGYPIEYKDMIGKVLFRIKYIGIPSVLIGEGIK